MENTYGLYSRPKLVELMEAIGLKAHYVKAEGDYLWRKKDNQLIKVLDLVGGYGSNLLGHYHPEIVKEVKRILVNGFPIHAQGSYRGGANDLIKKLRDYLGNYNVILTNSGAETIEAALKHVFMERPLSKCWAVKHSFHGKTLGSVQLTYSYQEKFSKYGFLVRFLDSDNPTDWRNAEEEAKDVSAIFIEPIRGEGGVKPLPDLFVQWLKEIASKYSIPIIADEIQTGMGRTGTFLASEQLGLSPDYICLSKSLGGSVAKIGALLIKQNRFIEEFSILHTSTFSEDDFSSRIALRVLEIIEEDKILNRCKVLGTKLRYRLNELKNRYPSIIFDVRGSGLMIGLQLSQYGNYTSNLLKMIAEENHLGLVVAAYLLNVHNIRVAPTLSNPNTLRIQPSAYLKSEDIDIFLNALSTTCKALFNQDTNHLLSFLVNRPTPKILNYRQTYLFKQDIPNGNKKVAFMGHLISPKDLSLWDKAIGNWSEEELKMLIERTSSIIGPRIYDRINITSATGENAHLCFVGLFLHSQQYEKALRNRNFKWIVEKIEKGIEIARDEGCQVIGLGGFNSILSGNCKRIKVNGIQLTSGNSFTVGIGVLALKQAASAKDIPLSTSSLAIIGATGNIASVYAKLMSPLVKELVLIVRNKNNRAVHKLKVELLEINSKLSIKLSDKVEDINNCELIVCASNSSKPLIFPEHLSKPGSRVICDISIPTDVDAEVTIKCPDVMVIQGGIVNLYNNNDFFIGGIPLEKGSSFACLAETVLMGFDQGETFNGSVGAINSESVAKTLKLGKKHGFYLGRLKKEKSF